MTLTLSEGRRAGPGALDGIAFGRAANAALSVLAASPIPAQGRIAGRRLGAGGGDDGAAGVVARQGLRLACA
ncbi:MAG: hypothetical protein ACK4RT_05225 [Erythrobacter sp.]